MLKFNPGHTRSPPLLHTHLARFRTNVEFLHAPARHEGFPATTRHAHPQGIPPRVGGGGGVGAVLQPLKEPVLLLVSGGRAEGGGGQLGRRTKAELVVRHAAGTGFGRGCCGCGLTLLRFGCILYRGRGRGEVLCSCKKKTFFTLLHVKSRRTISLFLLWVTSVRMILHRERF